MKAATHPVRESMLAQIMQLVKIAMTPRTHFKAYNSLFLPPATSPARLIR